MFAEATGRTHPQALRRARVPTPRPAAVASTVATATAEVAQPPPSPPPAPGNPAVVPEPLLPSPIPLTHAEILGGVTNIHLSLAAGPTPAAPAVAPPTAAVADAAHLPPATALAPGGLGLRSALLERMTRGLGSGAASSGLLRLSYALLPPPILPTLTAAAADAVHLLTAAAIAPGGLVRRSHPLLSPPIPLTRDESLLGVTNIHPPVTAGPLPATPTVAPPTADAADAAHLPPAAALAHGSLAERPYPLLPSPVPLTRDESLGRVTNVHPLLAAGPMPATPTVAPPIAAAADAAHLLPAAALAPGSLAECSYPLLPSPIPLTPEESLGGVTNIYPPLAAGPTPAAPTAEPPIVAAADAAHPLPVVVPAPGGLVGCSDPLPPSLLPLSAPPSTGDGWRCKCRPHQNWPDRRRCEDCGKLWCAACFATQCRCELEFFHLTPPQSRPLESDADHARSRAPAACAADPPPRPPTPEPIESWSPYSCPPFRGRPPPHHPDSPEERLLDEKVAVSHVMVTSPAPRPINGGTVGSALVHEPPILPEENASARTDRGCTSTPVTEGGGNGGHPDISSLVRRADTRDDKEKSRAFSPLGASRSERPGGRPDPSAQSTPSPVFLAVTLAHERPLGTPPASPPSSPPDSASPALDPDELDELLALVPLPPALAAPTPPVEPAGASLFGPPANAAVPDAPAAPPAGAPPELPQRPSRPRTVVTIPPVAPAGTVRFGPPADSVVPEGPAASPSSAPPELPRRPSRLRQATDPLPLSAVPGQSVSFVGVTNVHPQDASPALPADLTVPAELPDRPRRSFGPPPRTAPSASATGACPSGAPPIAPTSLVSALTTTPDDLLSVLAAKRKDPRSEIPSKPSRESSTQPSSAVPDEVARQLADPKKEAARIAKNAKAKARREKAAAERPAVQEDVSSAAEVVEEIDAPEAPRELTQHLLGEFDRASTSAEVQSFFTKQVTGIPTAIRTKVESGRVSILPPGTGSPHDSAGDGETSDGLSEIGGETPEPYEPAVHDYVQVKMTSASSFKGLVLQIHRVKGTQCTLRQIGAANLPGFKKPNVDVKSLNYIKSTGVTAAIHRNSANLQDYVNLRVSDPTLPEVPTTACRTEYDDTTYSFHGGA